ncbi:MAG: thiamine phosphate synthase [bacterium]
MKRVDYSLCVIIDQSIEEGLPLEEFIHKVATHGVTIFQVRVKDTSDRKFLDLAKRCIRVARRFSVPVVINDRVDIAMISGADGVHLGQEDIPIDEAKRLMPKDAIIGASARSVESAKEAQEQGASYIGLGPFFQSPTKPWLSPLPRELIREIRVEISLPIVAIGGINEANAGIAISEGANGVAIISALRQCPDPERVVFRIREEIEKARKG